MKKLLVALAFLAPAFARAAPVVIDTVDVGEYPIEAVTLGSNVYVANFNGRVSVIDTAIGDTVTSVIVGNATQDIDVAGSLVFTANFSHDNVSIIDTADGNSVTNVSVLDSPVRVAASGNKAYVLQSSTSTVTIIDTADGNSTTTVSVGTDPTAILVADGLVYVANYTDDTVSVIDADTDAVIDTVTVGDRPWGFAALGSKIYVGNTDGTMSVIDTEDSNSVESVDLKTSLNGSIAAVGSLVGVSGNAAGTVIFIDTEDGNSTSTVSVGGRGRGLIADGDLLYAALNTDELAVIDTADGNSVETVEVGVNPVSVAIVGERIYVVNQDDFTVSVLVPEDTTDPILTLLEGAPAETEDDAVSVRVSASDANPIELHVDGCSALDVTAGILDSDTTINFGSLAVNGDYACDVYVVDQQGNESEHLTVTFRRTGEAGATRGSRSGDGSSRGSGDDDEEDVAPAPAPAAPALGHAAAQARFLRDLQVDDVGEDVRALQKFLNGNGFPVAPSGPGASGSETSLFGPLTRAALVKFQIANGITPPAGYFGPITRGVVKILLGE
jgi:YVTN family beta-propeller protein